MKRIKEKKYYRIEFKLTSPLMLGAKQQERTDKDLLVDACGQPVIPGSALTGIYRSLLSLKQEEQKNYFGYVPSYEELQENQKDPAENISSRILVYDARLKTGENPHITRRDFVALDEYKTAKEGGKFDAEVLEPDVTFFTYIEQNIYDGDRDIAQDIATLWQDNRIVIGAKTMRGFGMVETIEIMHAAFLLEDKEQVSKWLKFDMFSEVNWQKWKSKAQNIYEKDVSVKLTLKLQGAISIRRYTTSVAENKNDTMPDQEQLTAFHDGKPCPVIPGSTWAGVFRSHIRKLMPKVNLDYFGYVRGKKKCRSKIRFSESRISGGEGKTLSRNAIDRFTGGTVNKALFTEKVHYGGQTELEIGFDRTIDKKLLYGLAAAMADLHYGFLSVGGETSIGHGLFKIVKIDETEYPELMEETTGEKLYAKFIEILMANMKMEE